ncbi:hypothetical protein ACFLVE_04395 [Chloroflexota bacterium]
MTQVKRIVSVVIALLVLCSGAVTLFEDQVLAQPPQYWAKTYGGIPAEEHADSVQQTSDGGYIVSGRTESFGAGDMDFWVLKLTSGSSIEWQKAYGGINDDHTHSMQQTSDGGYIVVGCTESFGAGDNDAWILKLNAQGTVEWQKTYGGTNYDWAMSVQQTVDGGYILAGGTESFGAGYEDAWILKLNSQGTIVWQKTYGGTSDDWADSVQQTTDGGYIVVGSTESFGAGYEDGWIFKLNSQGSVEWQMTFGSSIDSDSIHFIQQTSDGGYIAAGWTESFGAGGEDAWLLKLDSQGIITWQKTYGGTSDDWAESVQQTSDGGYIVVGCTESFGAGDVDGWIFKLSSQGSVQWQKTYGGSNWDYTYSIQQTSNGGYIVAGETLSFGAGNGDCWILKLDESGDIPECSIGVDSDITITNTYSSIVGLPLSVSDSIGSVSIPSYVVENSSCITDTQCYYTPTTPIVDEPSAQDGFASIAPFLETVYGFKTGEGTGGWTIYNPTWPTAMNSLTTLYVARGYWINVNEACVLQFGSSVIELGAGWNLIGWIPQL